MAKLKPEPILNGDLLEYLNSHSDFSAERTGLLQELGGGRYGFAHRSIQEYFAARELAVGNRWGIAFKQELDSAQWDSVLELAVELTGSVGLEEVLVDLLANPTSWKAVRLAGLIRKLLVEEPTSGMRLKDALTRLVESGSPPTATAARQVLNAL